MSNSNPIKVEVKINQTKLSVVKQIQHTKTEMKR